MIERSIKAKRPSTFWSLVGGSLILVGLLHDGCTLVASPEPTRPTVTAEADPTPTCPTP